ncbi:hypothetical protein DMENIID0001_089520 [Sergentomyia squamirostris]
MSWPSRGRRNLDERRAEKKGKKVEQSSMKWHDHKRRVKEIGGIRLVRRRDDARSWAVAQESPEDVGINIEHCAIEKSTKSNFILSCFVLPAFLRQPIFWC